MSLFAVSDAVWQTLINAVVGAVVTLALAYMAHKLGKVSAQVQEVKKATDGMKDQLVAQASAEGMARGGIEERQRADARKAVDDKATIDASAAADLKADAAEIKAGLAAVPETTAEKVVEKLEEKGGAP